MLLPAEIGAAMMRDSGLPESVSCTLPVAELNELRVTEPFDAVSLVMTRPVAPDALMV